MTPVLVGLLIQHLRNSISSSALVGYAAIDGGSSFVDNMSDFLACDRSSAASIDLFGLNN
jgi:hypothetical protein